MKNFALIRLLTYLTALCAPFGMQAHSLSAHPSHMAPSAPQSAIIPAAKTPAHPFLSTSKIVEYDLYIAEQTVSPAGKKVRALTINGGIPGPTLRFREGDTARIRVHNRLAHGETSLHWHGLLVPNAQDGVPHLTTPPIPAGGSLTFEFPLRQSGTYWFHSHTGLQEQQAVFGSIVITPRGGEPVHADREEVLVLSDWTNERPDEVLRTLKRGSSWYALKKGSAQSLAGAWHAGALSEYLHREQRRMPPMDVSDIAYDAFLINGKRESQLQGRPGETIRLRVINASAATYFYLESATGPLRIVASDGLAVQPLPVQRLLMGIAETYDVLVQVPDSGAWEVRATAQDGSGKASALLGNGPLHPAPDVPKPDLYHMDDMLMAALDESEQAEPVSPSSHHMPHAKTTPSASNPRPLSPYTQLRAPRPTSFSSTLPRRSMELHLSGDMQRYIWSFNGKTIDEEGVIPVKRGEVLRMELVNDTMMHHPIHLHGHFFRLLNGQGDFAPLKHTVDVPPMGRRIIEFEANEEGDWMFHCHVLYHMMEGMARVVSYRAPDAQGRVSGMHMGEHAMPMYYAFTDFNLLSNRSEGTARLMSGRNSLLATWDTGWRHSLGNAHYETDLLYERYLNINYGALGGIRLSDRPNAHNRAVAGGWYRLPFLITSTATADSKGAVRLELAKSFQLTPRLSLDARGRYDTREQWEAATTLNYTLTKRVALSAGYHSEYGLGAGLSLHF